MIARGMDVSGPPISLAEVPMASGAATITQTGDKVTGARASGHFMGKLRSKS